MLMLALLLFPMVEKTVHELSHVNEDHCAIKATHFCAKEEACALCDYVFSASSTPPADSAELKISEQIFDNAVSISVSNTITSPKYTFSLRGPPVC